MGLQLKQILIIAMKSVSLKYEISIINESVPTLSVTVDNKYFLQSVPIPRLINFPANWLQSYQYQVHPKCIQFIAKKSQKGTKDIQKLGQLVGNILSEVRVRVVRNKRVEKQQLYNQVFRLLDFGCCCGYKLMRKSNQDYKIGDIILFYLLESESKVTVLVDCIEGFSSKLLHFPLQYVMKEYKIPEELAMRTFKQMLNFYAAQIESVSTLYQIHISYMAICRRVEGQQQNKQKKYFIGMNIEGVTSNIHSFYLALEHTVFSFPLRLLEIDSIRGVKVNQMANVFKFQEGTRMVDGRNIVAMDRNMGTRQIIGMTVGYNVFGKDDFSQEGMSILETEIHGERFAQFMNNKQVHLDDISIHNNHILIKCQFRHIQKIKQHLKQFLSMFQKQRVKCTQFQNPLVRSIFYKNYRQDIQQQVNVKFEFINGQLIRNNYTLDGEKIKQEIDSRKQQILCNFVVVPSLNTISKYLANINNFEGLYRVEMNPQGMWEKNCRSVKYRLNKSRVQILLAQIENLVKYQQQMVLMLHNDLMDSSKIYSICADNKINANQFLKRCQGVKQCRVKRFPLKNSQNFKNITLIYFDVKRTILRHIDQDILNCLKSLQKEPKINLFIGLNSKRFVEQIIPKFLFKVNELAQNSEIKLKQLNMYYEEESTLAPIQRIIIGGKFDSTLVTRNVLDQWTLLRMNNLKQFVLSYFCNGQTETLPGLDSYIFQLQRKKSSKSRALVTIPTPEYLEQGFHQFCIDFQTDTIFQVCNYFKILTHHSKQLSKQFKRFLKLIQKQFNLSYFVAYARSTNGKIANQICLNIYYTQQKNKQMLIPLEFRVAEGSVALRKSGEYLPYNVSQKKYADWFKIYTHASQAHKVQPCLQR